MAARIFPVRKAPAAPVSFARFFSKRHPATDIFAPAGSDVLAVDDGKVRQAVEPRGGRVVYLKTNDGTQYYYAHLSGFAGTMAPTETRAVKAGDLLGYVGTTGSAQGTPPHVHFEWRPQGKAKADPFPLLERLNAETAGRALSLKPNPHMTKRAGVGGLGLLFLAWLALKD